ncbi:hypothetical protein MMC18_009040 [Xylographa bjoerkii]|nr:hypothetical protein [Xylographa bjoerkii]
MVLLVYWFVVSAPYRISNSFHASFGASDAYLTLLQYIDVAILSKWDFAYNGPQPREPNKKEISTAQKDTVWHRLRFGIYAASSYRCSGTSFEVSNLAPFDAKDRSYIPSRAKFLRGAIIRTVVAYFLIDALTSFGDPEAMAPIFKDEKIPLLSRLSELTLEEAITRTIASFSFWLVNYLVLILFFDVPGIICVATGLSGVSWWRPPFNSITEAYTLRRYWGVFWHQSVRKRINNPASFLTYSALHLRRGSLFARYTALFLTFVMSTCQHATGDIASGISLARTGSPSFFMVQGVGMVIEDTVQAAVAWLAPRTAIGKPALWHRLVGYAWVFLWMFWCTPFYSFPVSANNKGDKDAILPFSVLKALVSKVG